MRLISFIASEFVKLNEGSIVDEEEGTKEKEGVMKAFMKPPRDTATSQDFPFKLTPVPASVPVAVPAVLLSLTVPLDSGKLSNTSEEHSENRERRGLTERGGGGDSRYLLGLSVSQQEPAKKAMPTLSSVADPKSFIIALHAYGFSVSLRGEDSEEESGGGGDGGQGTEGKAQTGESGVTTPVLLDDPLVRLHKEGEEEGGGARVHTRIVPSSDEVSMLPQDRYFM